MIGFACVVFTYMAKGRKPHWTRLITEERTHFAVFTGPGNSGKTLLLFRDGPENLHALDEAPEKCEREIEQGKWLILVPAVWGIDDWLCILPAKRFAAAWKHVQVGVRPLQKPEEVVRWCTPFPSEVLGAGTPYWMAMIDGQLTGAEVGPLTFEQVEAFASKAGLINKAPQDVPSSLPNRTSTDHR